METLRQQVAQYRGAWDENKIFRELLAYKSPARFPQDYHAVAAAVVAQPSPQFQQQIVISAGTAHGVNLHDPVMGTEGLVGVVTHAAPGISRVALLTDGASAVSAEVLGRRATGLVRSGSAGSGMLALDLVHKKFRVRRGDVVVTAGSQVGQEPSLYPRGIPIGEVTFVNQTSTDLYKTIQVDPYVDFDALRSVWVLVPAAEPDAR